MRLPVIFSLLSLFYLLSLGSMNAFAEIVPGELLVVLKDQQSLKGKQAFTSKIKSYHAEIKDQGKFLHLKFSDKNQLVSEYKRLQDDPEVKAVQPNYRYRALAAPNDPYFSTQWALRNIGQKINSAPYPANNPGISGMDIGALDAWSIHSDCSNTVIAVIDTGVNYKHLDLQNMMWNGSSCVTDSGAALGKCIHGFDFIDGDNNSDLATHDGPRDYEGHGTHVAGIIGAEANNAEGISGICQKSKIMAIRVLDLDGGTSATIARGIDFAWRNGARVINMSLGGESEGFDTVLDQAMTRATNNNTFIVSAAGNDGENINGKNFTPCTLRGRGRVCVAAVDQKFEFATFSNYGVDVVDIAAPGTNINSAIHGTDSFLFEEDFLSGWNLSSSSWVKHDIGTCKIGSPTLIAYPAGYCQKTGHSGPVTASSQRDYLATFKNYDFVYSTFRLYLQLASTDLLTIAQSASSNIDFSNSSTWRWQLSGIEGQGDFTLPLRGCKGSDHCSVGVEFDAATSSSAQGAALGKLRFTAVNLSTNSFALYDGTSMAAPQVAGGVTLLRSLNPDFSVDDIFDALMASGQVVSGLSGKVSSSKVLDVDQLIRFIPAPEGLTVQQSP